ncbi:MAG: Fe-S-binding domain-containing protein, partial [Thermoanaerobaculia bacterium]
FQTSPRWTIVAATGVILAAIYLLWLIQRVFFGPITNEENRNVKEIAWNEIAALVPLVILMVWIGVRPNTFLRKMTPSVRQLLQIVQKTDAGKSMVASNAGGVR